MPHVEIVTVGCGDQGDRMDRRFFSNDADRFAHHILLAMCGSLEQARRMGRIEKGFDFLGCHFSPKALTLAQKTIENFDALRFYQQGPPHHRMTRPRDDSHRWIGWAVGVRAAGGREIKGKWLPRLKRS